MKLCLVLIVALFHGVTSYSQVKSKEVNEIINRAKSREEHLRLVVDMNMDSLNKKNNPFSEKFYQNKSRHLLEKVELYLPAGRCRIFYYFENEKLVYVNGRDSSTLVPLFIEIVYQGDKVLYASHSGQHGFYSQAQKLIEEAKSYQLRYKLFNRAY